MLFAFMLAKGQVQVLDDFETFSGWKFIRSDAVMLSLNSDQGYSGNCVMFQYDFVQGTGYGGIQKKFPIDLPENYEFTFYMKADSPPNNLEVKFIDSTGNNVWWHIYRNYDFPQEWTKIKIKKRNIEFAWGPTEDKVLKHIDRIEFTVSSFVGGKGTLWIDDLRFEPLPPETDTYPAPVITASSFKKNHDPALMMDHNEETYWLGKNDEETDITFDFRQKREFGGLRIDWADEGIASGFEILLSDDGNDWEMVYTVRDNCLTTSFIRLPEAEAYFLKLRLKKSMYQVGFGIREIDILNIHQSMTQNDFFIYAAKHSKAGYYPRYFYEQASYWTVIGANNDYKEALLNEDGMVEVEKGSFSIEPLLKIGTEWYNWQNVETTQSLGFDNSHGDPEYIPMAGWKMDGTEFSTEVAAGGEANKNSFMNIRYSINNTSTESRSIQLDLLIRPFQVNPYYQWLNITGGAGKIHSIGEEDEFIQVDGKKIYSAEKYSSFAAGTLDAGNLVAQLMENRLREGKSASNVNGMAQGVIRYTVTLAPGEQKEFNLYIPFYDELPEDESYLKDDIALSSLFWKEKVDHIKFNLPSSADRIIEAYKANLVYILVNKDGPGIQPGSRSYERSWIRDGSLTSSALLKSGIVQEVKDFIEWYASHQYDNGKVPCVVDRRGPDPVPENDSHGEMIYLIREYFNFTKDTSFLRSMNEHVLMAVDYIEYLVDQRSTEYYKNGGDSLAAFYGLVPESISHEGYSAKPMHSYWDDFFTMKGLKDAADIQKILGVEEEYVRMAKLRDTFKENLYHSIDLAMKNHGIDYIPGCVELGDFDATSTTIALTPCNELNNLPEPQVYNTFNKYYEYFLNRKDNRIDWVNYTPYENRLIGSFILLDEPEKAHELIRFFLHDQRPQGFHHWAEVVWKDYRRPQFIGDMPHTWVGSDFINAIRSMFVYENEYDRSLVLASALYQDWIDAPNGMSVENLPTYYGEVSYFIRKDMDKYYFMINGELDLPENGIRIKNFNSSKMPSRVIINGKESKDFKNNEITVQECPAEVEIYY